MTDLRYDLRKDVIIFWIAAAIQWNVCHRPSLNIADTNSYSNILCNNADHCYVSKCELEICHIVLDPRIMECCIMTIQEENWTE